MLFKRKHREQKIEFDEIFLDASNLPSFNQGRMEGRMELPITRSSVYVVGLIFSLIALLFFAKLFSLQVIHGASFRDQSEQNRISKGVIIAERGVIYDRNGELLAWNEHDYSDAYDFPVRAYSDRYGLGQLIGYVSYPQKDKYGFYFRTEYLGRNGVEGSYNNVLAGENGRRLVEVNAFGEIVSEHTVDAPSAGTAIVLSLDAELSEVMYNIIATSSAQAGFRSGAAAIMDVRTGEMLAMTSFPSYDPEVMADGDDADLIESYNKDDRFPFLNKVVGGAYTPGSVVKPFVAYAALKENVISENTHIYSNGRLTLPNPYTPSQPTHFNDWRSQGDMTVREAIAFSSNVFFYIIGGGLPEIAVPQAGLDYAFQGLGISKLHEYFDFFGFGKKTGIILANEQAGTIPSPEWKQNTFDEEWTLGNTYHTSIGQFGWQTTPLQMLVAYGALATGGHFFVPHIVKDEDPEYEVRELDPYILNIIKEGMRKTVNFPRGTARSFERLETVVAAKSGTAEIGSGNAYVNSWAAGFFPMDEPRYAFVLMMDRAPRSNTLGATTIMSDVLEWMEENRRDLMGLQPHEKNETEQ